MSWSADTTVAIVLGAQDFTPAGLPRDPAFAVSAMAVKDYLLRPSGLALPAHNILDLFDDPRDPGGLDAALDHFLVSRAEVLARTDQRITDVIVYYSGHGAFAPPGDDYVLAVRSTREVNLASSALRIVGLATTLKGRVRHARRYVILDCCFAASAYTAFQSTVLEAAAGQSALAFPGRGTALLCASAPDRPARSRRGSGATATGMTLFSECLVTVLEHGIPHVRRDRLTLGELGLAIEALMAERFAGEGPRPQVKSPDERDGDVTRFPLFPNPAFPGSATSIGSRVDPAPRGVGARVPRARAQPRRRGVIAATAVVMFATLPLAYSVSHRESATPPPVTPIPEQEPPSAIPPSSSRLVASYQAGKYREVVDQCPSGGRWLPTFAGLCFSAACQIHDEARASAFIAVLPQSVHEALRATCKQNIWNATHRKIEVSSWPPGAQVWIDGQPEDHVTPCEVAIELTADRLSNPTVHVQLRKRGFQNLERVVDLTGLTENSAPVLDLDLVAIPAR